mmetsp:Transcript_21160/g.32365  ORF Transcript_21160/g.32365 Transcript_21160/m.32365 type:complete len:87 (+) Transcript_21160:188-448(+)
MPKKGYINWANCKPRAVLLADLGDDTLPISEDSATAKQAWEHRYKQYLAFKDVCIAAFEQFQRLHPRPTHDHLGCPIFDNHPAKRS